MKKVIAPAIKTASGKITTAKPGQHHKDIGATGKRGFVVTGGAFVGRTTAAKVAKASGQAKVKKLHSTQLKGR